MYRNSFDNTVNFLANQMSQQKLKNGPTARNVGKLDTIQEETQNPEARRRRRRSSSTDGPSNVTTRRNRARTGNTVLDHLAENRAHLGRLTGALGDIAQSFNGVGAPPQPPSTNTVSQAQITTAQMLHQAMVAAAQALGNADEVRLANERGLDMYHGLMDNFAQDNNLTVRPRSSSTSTSTGEEGDGSEASGD